MCAYFCIKWVSVGLSESTRLFCLFVCLFFFFLSGPAVVEIKLDKLQKSYVFHAMLLHVVVLIARL